MWRSGTDAPGRQAREESRRLIARPADGRQNAVELHIPSLGSWQLFAALLIVAAMVSSLSVGVKHLKQQKHAKMAGDQFRDLEGETKTGGPNVALRSPECLKEGVTFPIKAILQNNLAGKGPDQGEETIEYLVTREAYGSDTEDFKVSLHAMSAYEPHPAEWNGLQGNFGIINELPGRDVRLRFKFKDMANAPVWLQSFDLLVCDLDGGSSSTEYVRAFGRHQAYWAKNTQLQLRSFGDSVEYSLNYPYRKELSSLTDLGAGNPTYAGELTPEQQRTCVSLRFGKVDHIDLVLGSERPDSAASGDRAWRDNHSDAGAPGPGVRSFFFAFTGLEHCAMQHASSSTTSTTATISTLTWTTHTVTSSTRSTVTTTPFSTSTIISRTSTTEVMGLPFFAGPGDLPVRPVEKSLRFLSLWAYVGVLVSIALGLVMYWLCYLRQRRGAISSQRLLQL
ncbi:unnamed protein product [Durusdinium trenchii]|uniref:Uncharacterized protein n=2 Tax=Durusdinium trenchii TaxID=1381693 RepID=A0ABP0SJU9_9DINO